MIDRDIFLRDAPDDVREDLAFAQWQENNRIGTHAEGCHTWGIGHYACALRRITELAAQLADAIDDAHREARELDRVNVKLADAQKDARHYCVYTRCADDSPTPNTLESGCDGAVLWYLGDDGKGDYPKFCHHCGGSVKEAT